MVGEGRRLRRRRSNSVSVAATFCGSNCDAWNGHVGLVAAATALGVAGFRRRRRRLQRRRRRRWLRRQSHRRRHRRSRRHWR